jgi:hypothetical protein
MTIIHSQEFVMSPKYTIQSRLFAIACLPMLALELAAPMLVRAMDSEDLYQLCASFPYNSQCKGYEAPVPLSQRSGQLGGCVIQLAAVETKGACKVSLENDTITLYQEVGTGLKILNDQKSTRMMVLPAQSVSTIQYREAKKLNSGNAVFNTLAFGLLGLALTKKRKYAEISLNYRDAVGPNNPTMTMLIFDQKTGLAMREQLEKLTGKTVELPEQKP